MILSILKNISNDLKTTHPNSKMYLTGGIVRSMIWNTFDEEDVNGDYDIEVFGVKPSEFFEFISRHVDTDAIWSKTVSLYESVFPTGHKVQWNFPRRERSTGIGHNDFDITIDENMSVEEAQSRRDYTMNAVYFDIDTGEFIDNFGGISDAEARILKVISDSSFVDDPLRILRGIRFASEHSLRFDEDTLEKAGKYVHRVFNTISKERLWQEFHKFFMGKDIISGLLALRNSFLINHVPCLNYMTSHVYNWDRTVRNTWERTLESFVFLEGSLDKDESLTKEDKMIIRMAYLFADVGKSYVTGYSKGRKTYYPGHEKNSAVGFEMDFAGRILMPPAIQKPVIILIKEHEFINDSPVNPVTARHLKHRLQDVPYNHLRHMFVAHHYVSPIDFTKLWDLDKMMESVDITPFVLGRDLIDLGMKPGPLFSVILNEVYIKQLDGVVKNKEESLKYIKESIWEVTI